MKNKLLILLLIIIVITITIFILYYPIIFSTYIVLASKESLDPFPDIYNRRSIRAIKDAYPVIKKELEEVRKTHPDAFSPIKGDQFFETIVKDSKWKKIYLKWYSKSPRYAYKLFPKTMKIIDKHPDIHLAMFSLLEAGGEITKHCGPNRGAIRVHLCLEGPNSDDCFISVNGEKYSWREGEIVALDDTYEHYVINNTNKDRIVLFLDVERRVHLNWINRWVIKNVAPTTTRMNDDLEKKCARKIR